MGYETALLVLLLAPEAFLPLTADLRVAELRLGRITVTYPGRSQPALDGIDLTIAPGERIVLTGPSGAGKSTLLVRATRQG